MLHKIFPELNKYFPIFRILFYNLIIIEFIKIFDCLNILQV